MPRSCTVCTHDERDAIDEALIARTPYRDIAKRHEVTISALSRHMDGHVSPALAAVVAKREGQRAESLHDRVESLCSHVETILDASKEDGKVSITLSAARELRGCLELLGKITGELRDQPSTVVNVLSSTDWHAIRGALFDALAAHPEAREAVARRLLELEPAS